MQDPQALYLKWPQPSFRLLKVALGHPFERSQISNIQKQPSKVSFLKTSLIDNWLDSTKPGQLAEAV